MELIPFSFYYNGEEHRVTSLEQFDGHAYYDMIRAGTDVTTSLVEPQRYIDGFTPLLREGRDILFVGMSSGISGSYASAEVAAATLREEFPERKIRLVDTLSASLGEGPAGAEGGGIPCRRGGYRYRGRLPAGRPP